MGYKIGLEEETHNEEHTDSINKEAAKLHAKHTKVQHHNSQVEELVEETEESKGDPS
jgi:hypothetical protein